MIFPDKYTDFNLSLLSVGGVILKSLKNCHVQKYGEVEEFAVSKLGLKSKIVFLYALGFLYILGKISYSKDTDVIKLLDE